jgi:flavin-dependent dehydrogenase
MVVGGGPAGMEAARVAAERGHDWGPSTRLVEELSGLVDETYVVGSSKQPGWIVDAIREGALAGYSM